MLAADDNVAVRRDHEVQRTEFGVSYEARRYLSARRDRDNCVVAFSVRTDTRCKEQPTVPAKCESAWKRYDVQRQSILTSIIQRTRKCHDGTRAAQANIITAVWPKNAAAGI